MDDRIAIRIWCNQKPRNNICVDSLYDSSLFNKTASFFFMLPGEQYGVLQIVV